MKKLLWLGILCSVPGYFTMAQKTVGIESLSMSAASLATPNDTISEKVPLTVNTKTTSTSKKGFRDLFENEGSAGSSGPRLNPRAVSFVQDYIEKYEKDLTDMKDWGRPYFNLMDVVLISHHLPKELKYLAVIESRLHTGAVSWAGAVGPWQLMPATARVLGLKINWRTDERTNYIKSTHAAARYLNDLYTQFGDWLLVIAAYNGGPGNVLKAIRKSGSRNFWVLQNYLPAESRNHVKKFIGTHYIFERQGGLTTLTRAETTEHYGENGLYIFNRRLNQDELNNSKAQTVSGKYNSVVIAKYLMMDLSDFNRYNPDFDKVMGSASAGYELKLPAEKMELFNANKYQILNESIQLMLNAVVSVSNTGSPKENTMAKAQK